MNDPRYRKVPSARLSRLASIGQIASGVAGGMLAEGVRRLAAGERPKIPDLLLTAGNIERVANQLSHLRGAAMKLGQLISMDAGDFLPAHLTSILARLRDGAHFMPPSQLEQVLVAEWGTGWRDRFSSFGTTPIAAASIGQVHRAALPDGRQLAIKVQYPGVADSIDADVDNVAGLLRISGLLPRTIDLGPLLMEAKRQLHEETNYVREADQIQKYRALLADDPRFIVPAPIDEFSGSRVLAMEYMSGRPIESLQASTQPVRDAAMAALMGLVLRELFEFGCMQSDPNFANYRWQEDTRRIVLLDFGAARAVPAATTQAYCRLMYAGLAGDQTGLKDTLVNTGFLSATTLARHPGAIDEILRTLLQHLGKPGAFDFADRAFVERVMRRADSIVADREAWHIPPAETLFVQRKISGTALLAVRMRARMPLRDMVEGAISAGGRQPG